MPLIHQEISYKNKPRLIRRIPTSETPPSQDDHRTRTIAYFDFDKTLGAAAMVAEGINPKIKAEFQKNGGLISTVDGQVLIESANSDSEQTSVDIVFYPDLLKLLSQLGDTRHFKAFVCSQGLAVGGSKAERMFADLKATAPELMGMQRAFWLEPRALNGVNSVKEHEYSEELFYRRFESSGLKLESFAALNKTEDSVKQEFNLEKRVKERVAEEKKESEEATAMFMKFFCPVIKDELASDYRTRLATFIGYNCDAYRKFMAEDGYPQAIKKWVEIYFPDEVYDPNQHTKSKFDAALRDKGIYSGHTQSFQKPFDENAVAARIRLRQAALLTQELNHFQNTVEKIKALFCPNGNFDAFKAAALEIYGKAFPKAGVRENSFNTYNSFSGLYELWHTYSDADHLSLLELAYHFYREELEAHHLQLGDFIDFIVLVSLLGLVTQVEDEKDLEARLQALYSGVIADCQQARVNRFNELDVQNDLFGIWQTNIDENGKRPEFNAKLERIGIKIEDLKLFIDASKDPSKFNKIQKIINLFFPIKQYSSSREQFEEVSKFATALFSKRDKTPENIGIWSNLFADRLGSSKTSLMRAAESQLDNRVEVVSRTLTDDCHSYAKDPMMAKRAPLYNNGFQSLPTDFVHAQPLEYFNQPGELTIYDSEPMQAAIETLLIHLTPMEFAVDVLRLENADKHYNQALLTHPLFKFAFNVLYTNLLSDANHKRVLLEIATELKQAKKTIERECRKEGDMFVYARLLARVLEAFLNVGYQGTILNHISKGFLWEAKTALTFADGSEVQNQKEMLSRLFMMCLSAHLKTQNNAEDDASFSQFVWQMAVDQSDNNKVAWAFLGDLPEQLGGAMYDALRVVETRPTIVGEVKPFDLEDERLHENTLIEPLIKQSLTRAQKDFHKKERKIQRKETREIDRALAAFGHGLTVELPSAFISIDPQDSLVEKNLRLGDLWAGFARMQTIFLEEYDVNQKVIPFLSDFMKQCLRFTEVDASVVDCIFNQDPKNTNIYNLQSVGLLIDGEVVYYSQISGKLAKNEIFPKEPLLSIHWDGQRIEAAIKLHVPASKIYIGKQSAIQAMPEIPRVSQDVASLNGNLFAQMLWSFSSLATSGQFNSRQLQDMRQIVWYMHGCNIEALARGINLTEADDDFAYTDNLEKALKTFFASVSDPNIMQSKLPKHKFWQYLTEVILGAGGLAAVYTTEYFDPVDSADNAFFGPTIEEYRSKAAAASYVLPAVILSGLLMFGAIQLFSNRKRASVLPVQTGQLPLEVVNRIKELVVSENPSFDNANTILQMILQGDAFEGQRSFMNDFSKLLHRVEDESRVIVSTVGVLDVGAQEKNDGFSKALRRAKSYRSYHSKDATRIRNIVIGVLLLAGLAYLILQLVRFVNFTNSKAVTELDDKSEIYNVRAGAFLFTATVGLFMGMLTHGLANMVPFFGSGMLQSIREKRGPRQTQASLSSNSFGFHGSGSCKADDVEALQESSLGNGDNLRQTTRADEIYAGW